MADGTPAGSTEHQIEPRGLPVQHVQQVAPQPTLEDIIKAAGPIATAYFASQERIEDRSATVEEKAVASEERQQGRGLLVVTCLSFGIMVLAGILIFRGQEQTATNMVGRMVSLAAAGFGGYGLGRIRERAAAKEE